MEGGRASSEGVSFCCCGCPRDRGRTKVRADKGKRKEPGSQDGVRVSEGTESCWQGTPLETRVQDAEDQAEIFCGNFGTIFPFLWGILARSYSAHYCPKILLQPLSWDIAWS